MNNRARWFPVALATVFVLAMVAARWDARTGMTQLLSFGGPKWDERLPELRPLPVAKDKGTGYDGQFGAQLAVNPHPADAEVQIALDNPSYRCRRMLLSWTAHALGGGDPWRVLEVYALQNVFLWLVLSCVVFSELRPLADGRAVAVWVCCMLTVGALDSVRLSLTDLSAVFALAVAVKALQRGRPWAATTAFALGGLARETTLLGVAGLWPSKQAASRTRLLAVTRITCALLPVLAWTAWLATVIPGHGALGRGNFDWPGVALVRHCLTCLSQLASGNFDSRYLFGLIGAVGLAAQSVRILATPQWSEPWWRIGLGFALLFWVLGDEVWRGYWAAARAVLPMTFAINILTPDDRRFWRTLALGNAGLVLHGVWRMLP